MSSPALGVEVSWNECTSKSRNCCMCRPVARFSVCAIDELGRAYIIYSRLQGLSCPGCIYWSCRFNARDPVAGKLYVFVLALLYLVYLLLCWWRPEQVQYLKKNYAAIDLFTFGHPVAVPCTWWKIRRCWIDAYKTARILLAMYIAVDLIFSLTHRVLKECQILTSTEETDTDIFNQPDSKSRFQAFQCCTSRRSRSGSLDTRLLYG